MFNEALMLPFSTKTVFLFRSIKYFSSILTTLDETSGHLKQFYRKAHDIPESSYVTSFFYRCNGYRGTTH